MNEKQTFGTAPSSDQEAKVRMLGRRGFLKASGLSVLTVGGVTLLTACGGSGSSASTGSAAGSASSSSDESTLRVGMEAAYAPYNWQTDEESEYTIPIADMDGQYADGFDVQIAKKVGEGLDREPVAVKLAWDGLINAVTNGTIDFIIAGMTATDERKESIDFSDPYFVGSYGLLVLKDSKYASATTLAEFAGASVLGQKDTLLDTIIDDIPDVNHLTPVASVPAQVSALNSGTCDAITYNVENTKGFLEANPNFVAVDFAEGDGFKETVPVNIGLKKGQDDLLAQINDILSQIDDDTRQEMFDAAVERQPK